MLDLPNEGFFTDREFYRNAAAVIGTCTVYRNAAFVNA